jgi:hypothetical protein
MAPLLQPPETNRDYTPPLDPATRGRIERVAEEKARALSEPGPSWREWLFYQALKWWLAIVLIIVDSWVVVFWVEYGSLSGLLASIIVTIYAEFLLYRYLWYRPNPEQPRMRGKFRPTWYRPVEYGRWTPEADMVRSGIGIYDRPEGPDPKEFL